MYQKPSWTSTGWLLNKMRQRRLQARLRENEWDGRQRRSVSSWNKAEKIRGHQDDEEEVPARYPVSAGGYMDSARRSRHVQKSKYNVNLFPWFPRAFQKKRPASRVDYKCECEFGFTGYHCESWYTQFVAQLGAYRCVSVREWIVYIMRCITQQDWKLYFKVDSSA